MKVCLISLFLLWSPCALHGASLKIISGYIDGQLYTVNPDPNTGRDRPTNLTFKISGAELLAGKKQISDSGARTVDSLEINPLLSGSEFSVNADISLQIAGNEAGNFNANHATYKSQIEFEVVAAQSETSEGVAVITVSASAMSHNNFNGFGGILPLQQSLFNPSLPVRPVFHVIVNGTSIDVSETIATVSKEVQVPLGEKVRVQSAFAGANSRGSRTGLEADWKIQIKSVQPKLSITRQPLDRDIEVGKTANFTVEASLNGNESDFQWFRNNQLIPGANESSCHIQSVSTQDSGAYKVRVRAFNQEVFSENAALNVISKPKFIQKPTDVAAKIGDVIKIQVEAIGDQPLSYEWIHGIIPLNATGPVLDIPDLQNAHEGAYLVYARNKHGTAVTAFTIFVREPSAPPKIMQLTSQKGRIFLRNTLPSVNNTYKAVVDWGEHRPGNVIFTLEGQSQTKPVSFNGQAQITYAVSDNFAPFAGNPSHFRLQAMAFAEDTGIRSEPQTIEITIVRSTDSILSTLFKPFVVSVDDQPNEVNYSMSWKVPAVPFSITVDLPNGLSSLAPFSRFTPFTVEKFQAQLDLGFDSHSHARAAVKSADGFKVGLGKWGVRPIFEGKAKAHFAGDQILWDEISGRLGVGLEVENEYRLSQLLPVSGRIMQILDKFVQVKLLAGISGHGRLTYSAKTNEWIGELIVGSRIAIRAEIQPYSNVKVSASGSGGSTFTWSWRDRTFKDAEAFVEAKFEIVFNSLVRSVLSEEWRYPPKKTLSRLLYGADWSFEPISRVFLENPGYNRFAFASKPITQLGGPDIPAAPAGAADEPVLLVSNVFPYSTLALAAYANDQHAIAYVVSDPKDPVLRANEIFFTYYNGTNYAMPAPIIDDQISDHNPQLAFSTGGGRSNVVAVWERIKTASTNLDEMLASTEIVCATYELRNRTWSSPASLTTNDFLDYSPKLVRGASADSLLLYWLSNRGNELLGDTNSPAEVHFASWNNAEGRFMEHYSYSNLTDVVGFDVGLNASQEALLVYCRDMDGEVSTANDIELFAQLHHRTSVDPPIRLTTNSVPDLNPLLQYDSAGKVILVWSSGSDISRLINWPERNHEIIASSQLTNPPALFCMASEPDSGRTAVAWQQAQAESLDLHLAAFDSDRVVGSGVRIGDSNGVKHQLRMQFAAGNPKELKLVYLQRNDNNNTDLYFQRQSLRPDLVLEGNGPHFLPAETNAPAQLRAVVRNVGTLPAKPIVVEFLSTDGESLGFASASTNTLAAGDSMELLLPWTNSIPPQSIHFQLDPWSEIIAEVSTNNALKVSLLEPDLQFEGIALDRLSDGNFKVTAGITNTGRAAEGFSIVLEIDGKPVETNNIPALTGFGKREIEMVIEGNRVLSNSVVSLVIDHLQIVAEMDESNNQASLPINPFATDGGLNALSGVVLSADINAGMVQLEVRGDHGVSLTTENSDGLRIQWSFDLTTWNTINTAFAPVNGKAVFLAPESTNMVRRFYRVLNP